MLKNKISVPLFATSFSLLNLLLFHHSFFKFVLNNLDYKTLNGSFLLLSFVLMVFLANYMVFYVIIARLGIVGKILISLFFIVSALSIYFVDSYSVIIDESMIGNVLNTNYTESTSFLSLKLFIYLLLLGCIPSIVIFKIKFIRPSLRQLATTIIACLTLILIFVFANSKNWLWIDKNSKTLGGLVMPWSYTVNTALFVLHEHQSNQKEILLPNAKIIDNGKAVMVLVIGESARRENFSLYGYAKNTNPLLSKIKNLHIFNANSCATYTTAGVKCILENQNTDDLYEILPNYLYRNNVDVVWRTSNWGEPPVHIRDYKTLEKITANCKGEDCKFDDRLIDGLKQRILSSKSSKMLIVLHTSTSHGPNYSLKYPKKFEVFKPVCNSVELSQCSSEELINAYDNTIVFTDYILSKIINELSVLKGYRSSMIYVSDHGESLGEKNLYMHGMPVSIAPRQQYEIPFIVWSSGGPQLKTIDQVSQNYVFHSVLRFLGVQSPIYNKDLSLFK